MSFDVIMWRITRVLIGWLLKLWSWHAHHCFAWVLNKLHYAIQAMQLVSCRFQATKVYSQPYASGLFSEISFDKQITYYLMATLTVNEIHEGWPLHNTVHTNINNLYREFQRWVILREDMVLNSLSQHLEWCSQASHVHVSLWWDDDKSSMTQYDVWSTMVTSDVYITYSPACLKQSKWKVHEGLLSILSYKAEKH